MHFSIYIHLLFILETIITWWYLATNISLIYLISFSNSRFTADSYPPNRNTPTTRGRNKSFILRFQIIILFIFYLPTLYIVIKIQSFLFYLSTNSAKIRLEYSVKSRSMTPYKTMLFLKFSLPVSTIFQSYLSTIPFMCLT